jgi:hypothetical protein
MVKPPLRTKFIGFKVSEEEYAQLETAAQANGWRDKGVRRDIMTTSVSRVGLILSRYSGPVDSKKIE